MSGEDCKDKGFEECKALSLVDGGGVVLGLVLGSKILSLGEQEGVLDEWYCLLGLDSSTILLNPFEDFLDLNWLSLLLIVFVMSSPTFLLTFSFIWFTICLAYWLGLLLFSS